MSQRRQGSKGWTRPSATTTRWVRAKMGATLDQSSAEQLPPWRDDERWGGGVAEQDVLDPSTAYVERTEAGLDGEWGGAAGEEAGGGRASHGALTLTLSETERGTA